MVEEAHNKGLKVIYDHVANHVGINHEWVNILPMENWFNGSAENHQRNFHNKMSAFDIHSDSQYLIENKESNNVFYLSLWIVKKKIIFNCKK